MVELQPGAAIEHFPMEAEILFLLGVDGNEALGRAAFGGDDVELVEHDTPLDCVRADDGAGAGRGAGGGTQDARLERGDAVIASADLDPGGRSEEHTSELQSREN